MKLLTTCFALALGNLDYHQIFVPDPKYVLGGKRPEGQKENLQLLEANKKWIAEKGTKSVTKAMLNIPNTMPITPHGVYKYVDDSPYCWVIYAYDSDEDPLSEIEGQATYLSEYFYERCQVGMLDMAYPSNKFTFGYLIEDYPMLLLKKAGREFKMLQDYIEMDSFVLQDRSHWGKRILTEDLEDDIDEILSGIIDDFYEPMNDFHKMTSIHVQWYGFQNEHKEKAQALIRDHVKDLAEAIEKEDDEEAKKMTKLDFFGKVAETKDELSKKLVAGGFEIKPRKIKNFFDGNFFGFPRKNAKSEL